MNKISIVAVLELVEDKPSLASAILNCFEGFEQGAEVKDKIRSDKCPLGMMVAFQSKLVSIKESNDLIEAAKFLLHFKPRASLIWAEAIVAQLYEEAKVGQLHMPSPESQYLFPL